MPVPSSVVIRSKNPYSFGADTSSATGEGDAKLHPKSWEKYSRSRAGSCPTTSKCTTGWAMHVPPGRLFIPVRQPLHDPRTEPHDLQRLADKGGRSRDHELTLSVGQDAVPCNDESVYAAAIHEREA